MTAALPPDHTPSGASTGEGNAAAPPEVQVMFDRIAPQIHHEPAHLRVPGAALAEAAGHPGGAWAGSSALDVASGNCKVAADLTRGSSPAAGCWGWTCHPG